MAAYFGNYTGISAEQWIDYCIKTGQELPDWATEFFAAKAAEEQEQDSIEAPVEQPTPKRTRRSTKPAEVA